MQIHSRLDTLTLPKNGTAPVVCLPVVSDFGRGGKEVLEAAAFAGPYTCGGSRGSIGRRRSDEGQGATAGVRDAGLRQWGKQRDRGVRVPVDAGACVGVGTLADGLLRRSQRGLGGSVQGQAAEDRPPMVNPPALPRHTF